MELLEIMVKLLLQEELKEFWSWAGITKKEYNLDKQPSHARQAEWEDYYPYWHKIERAFYIELEKYNEEISDERARLLLETMAIDNVGENVREILSIRMNRSDHYHFISIGLDFELYQARWQLAVFMLYSHIDDRINFLVRMFDIDPYEYVQRRALLSLFSIAPKKSEIHLLKALKHTDEYMRYTALQLLVEMNSRHLLDVKKELSGDLSSLVQEELKKIY